MAVDSRDGRPSAFGAPGAALRFAAVLAVSAVATIAAAVPHCLLIAGGSFIGGLDGWTAEPTIHESGGAQAGAVASVVPGDGLLVKMDEHVARLSVFANAGLFKDPPPDGCSSSASMSLKKTVVATQRFLKFTRAGGWEAVYFAEGSFGFDLTIIVRGVGGSVVSRSIDGFDGVPGFGCDVGVSILGAFDWNDPEVFLDVLTVGGEPSGISLGEEVQIEVLLSCLAGAETTCDEAEMYAILYVDQFEFCDDAPIRADLNGDGVVNTLDLGIMLASWSIPAGSLGCAGAFPCAADLDDDLVVNSLDLGILLSSWTLQPEAGTPSSPVITTFLRREVSTSRQP